MDILNVFNNKNYTNLTDLLNKNFLKNVDTSTISGGLPVYDFIEGCGTYIQNIVGHVTKGMYPSQEDPKFLFIYYGGLYNRIAITNGDEVQMFEVIKGSGVFGHNNISRPDSPSGWEDYNENYGWAYSGDLSNGDGQIYIEKSESNEYIRFYGCYFPYWNLISTIINEYVSDTTFEKSLISSAKFNFNFVMKSDPYALEREPRNEWWAVVMQDNTRYDYGPSHPGNFTEAESSGGQFVKLQIEISRSADDGRPWYDITTRLIAGQMDVTKTSTKIQANELIDVIKKSFRIVDTYNDDDYVRHCGWVYFKHLTGDYEIVVRNKVEF